MLLHCGVILTLISGKIALMLAISFDAKTVTVSARKVFASFIKILTS